jgi:hypothetical protein
MVCCVLKETLIVGQKVAMIQDMKRDIAAGAFSSDSQVGVVNKSSRLQVRAATIYIQCGAESLWFQEFRDAFED